MIRSAAQKTNCTSKKTGTLIIPHDEALQILLASEASSKLSQKVGDELPAVISHWLQSPEMKPVLADMADAVRWEKVLKEYTHRMDLNPATPVKKRKTHKKISIDYSSIPFPPPSKPKFKFIDLFAGIGGFRVALQDLEGKCVFSSEWDKFAKETYFQNYGEVPFGDITNFTKLNEEGHFYQNSIPDHDILCGGFPCQPFSQAGKQLGFEDARGTLFFDVLKIAKEKKPRVVFLENVKRLKGHDKGKTFKIICNSLEEIGYNVFSKVVKAYDHGVPQNRERIFIVAFAQNVKFTFPENNPHSIYKSFGDILEKYPDEWYTISDKLWAGHQRRKKEHKLKGNGFGYSLFDKDDLYVNTISARYWKDGSEILVKQDNKNPRKLTPRECARLQGYPDFFKLHESRRHCYQQFGNSVAVPVIRNISKQIIKSLSL